VPKKDGSWQPCGIMLPQFGDNPGQVPLAKHARPFQQLE
jgi:hypothetical protein